MNIVHIVGRLGRDPELRYTTSGMAVCSLAVATEYKRKDKGNGETIKETQWHDVTIWDKQAENASNFLGKGCRVQITGRLKTESYEKGGVKHYRTKIVCEHYEVLDYKDSAEKPTEGARPAPPKAGPKTIPPKSPPPAQAQAEFDDDIPF
jgi:single-strand DNA-binding protein